MVQGGRKKFQEGQLPPYVPRLLCSLYNAVAEYGYLLKVMILNTAFSRTFTSFKYLSAAFPLAIIPYWVLLYIRL